MPNVRRKLPLADKCSIVIYPVQIDIYPVENGHKNIPRRIHFSLNLLATTAFWLRWLTFPKLNERKSIQLCQQCLHHPYLHKY